MKKTILILGGGFGGVYTTVYLEKLMTAAERETTDIVIVSRDNYIVFQPLLPEVISGSVELNHVICPIRRLAKTARLYTREVEAIDLTNRTVRLSPGAKPVAAVRRPWFAASRVAQRFAR
jgi:NADH dehydrogenase